MMKKFKNKRAQSTNLTGIVVYYVVVIIFLLLGLSVVYIKTHDSSVQEQVYAKQIALMIDKAKPGMNISFDISKMYEIASKNKYNGNVINIDSNNKKVYVNLISEKSYQYNFFSNVKVVWDIKKDEKKLYMEFVENE